MPPRQSYQPPSQPQQPQRSATPQAPHYGYGTPGSQHFQQHPSGHYEVVPTPQGFQNDGHTGHNPYDFIMSPNATGRTSWGASLTGTSFLMRIALLGGGLVVIMIVAAVLISALSPKGSTPGMTSIAQRQQEIVRVATAATQQTTSQDAKNFVTNVEMSVTSSQQQVVNYLATHGAKLGDKQLALDQSTQTDSELASAATANNYDSAVTQNLTTQLQVYESLLKTTYGQTSNPESKQLLQSSFNSANLLLTQAKNLSTELGQ